MSRLRTMDEAWRLFELHALSAAASAGQRRLLRRAFYRGAEAVVAMTAVSVEEPLTQDHLDVMGGVLDELEAFDKAVTRGEA